MDDNNSQLPNGHVPQTQDDPTEPQTTESAESGSGDIQESVDIVRNPQTGTWEARKPEDPQFTVLEPKKPDTAINTQGRAASPTEAMAQQLDPRADWKVFQARRIPIPHRLEVPEMPGQTKG